MTLTVYSIDGVTPVVDPTAYVHPSAVLIGDVIVGPAATSARSRRFVATSVASGSRRAPTCRIRCIMHGFPGTDTVVEENGHIGHAAVLHSCAISKNALVGMNAVVNDNAVDRRMGDRRCDGFRQSRHDRGAAHVGCRHAGARCARADRAGARMEGSGTHELPGAHAPLPRDDEGDVAARRTGTGSQASLEMPGDAAVATRTAKRPLTRERNASRRMGRTSCIDSHESAEAERAGVIRIPRPGRRAVDPMPRHSRCRSAR